MTSDKVFIRVPDFTDDANMALTKAISYWNKYNTKEVYTSQLFIALVEKAKSRDEILKTLGTTYDKLFKAYELMLENHELELNETDFEEVSIEDIKSFNIDVISDDIINLFTLVIYYAQEEDKRIDCEFIIRVMLDHLDQNPELVELLEYADVDTESIERTLKSQKGFVIPKSLEGYVKDLSTNKKVLGSKIMDYDKYTDEMIEILSRKDKANPCLIGESGVGKTTLVYALVQRILSGDVPDEFKNKHIVALNSPSLTAGMVYGGAFQGFMKTLMTWAEENDVILFFDEIHALMNAGKTSNDSADTGGNILKAELEDGSLRIIGATTLSEYHRFMEKDTAFTRRIQEIEVKEPTAEHAIDMIEATIRDYEEYHNVRVPRSTIELAVRLSHRYIKDRFLPDKAYSIIDQACTKVKLNKKVTVDENAVYEVVSKISGVDIKKLSGSEARLLLKLENTIEKRVVGQSNAVHRVCKAIRRAKAGTRDSNKPIATFLFVGPTGVGKTELCKVLGDEVVPGRENFIKVDMSEYSEKASVAKFIGSAPGYVGYGEGGQLTEKVKHNPYSVVLFDEIEKAHPDVFNIFLQLLDEGRMTDGSGQTVDFTNCIVIMTSNAGYGAETISKKSVGFGIGGSEVKEDEAEEKDKRVRKALEETFKPEFLNRLDDIIVFDKLSKEHSKMIVKLLLKQLSDRVKENRKVDLKFTPSVVDMLSEVGYSDKYGARNIKRKIQDIVEDELSVYLLDGTIKDGCAYTVSYNSTNREIVLK